MFTQNLYTNVSSSFIHYSPKLGTTRCPSVGEQLDILWWIHIMDCCSGRALRTNWVQAITWANIQKIKLSGKAYPKSLHTVWFHLYNSHERTKQKWRTNWWLPGFEEGMGHERRGCGDRSITGDILVVMKMSVSWLCQCQYPDYDLYCSFARCYHGSEEGKGNTGSLCIIRTAWNSKIMLK